MADNKITVTLNAKNDMSGTLSSAGRELQDFASKADAIGSRFEAAGLRIGAMGLAANAGLSRLGLDLKSVVEASVDTEKALFGIASTAGINGAAAEAIAGKWSLALDQIAKQTNQTKSQLITAFQDMVAKGISEQDAMKMLAPIGKAATATNSSIRDIAVTVAASFSKMEISGERVAKVLDVMAAAGDAGAFELKDMAQYMDMLTAKSASLGAKGEASMTQLAAAAQLARMGTGDAASAATNLANWMDKLNASSTAKNFEDMGVSLEKLKQNARESGNFIGYMLAEIKKITGGDAAKIAKLFPDVQAGSYAQLATQTENLKEYFNIVNKAGEATGVVDEKFDTMMRTTSAKLQSVQINLAGAIEGSKVVQGLLSSLEGLGAWAAEHPEIAGFIGIGAATTAAVGLAGGAIVAGIGATISAIGSLTSAAVGFVGLVAANPVLATLFGAATVATFVYTHWDDVTAYFQSWWGKIESLFMDGGESVRQALLNLTPLGIVAKGFDALGQYFSGLIAKWKVAGSDMIGALLSGIWEGIQSLPFGIGAKITEAVRYVGNFARDWWNAGKNLMSSLLDGIKSKYNDIVGSIKRLGLNMSSAIGIKSAAAAEKEWTGSFGVMKRPAASGSVAPVPASSAPAPKFESYLTSPTGKGIKADPERKKILEEGIALTASLRTEQEKSAAAAANYKRLFDANAITLETFRRAMLSLDPELQKQSQAMQDGAALTASLRTEQEKMMDTITGYVNLLERGAISQDTFNNAIAALDPEVQKQNQAIQDGAALRASLRTEQERMMDTITGYVNLLERGVIVQDEFNQAISAMDPELQKQNQAMQDGAALRASLRTEQERLMDTISGYVNLLERGAIVQDEFNNAITALDPELQKQNQAMQDGASLRASLRTEQERMMDTISGYVNLLERTAITQDEFNEAIAALDPELKKQNQAMQDGASLRASLRTEQERMMDTITGYVNLLERGAISQDTFNNAIAALDPELQKQNQAMQDGAALRASLRTEQERMMDTISGYVNLLERTAITQDEFNEAIAALDPELKKQNQAMQDGAALRASLRTEQERMMDTISGYVNLLERGAIIQDEFNQAISAMDPELQKQNQAMQDGASLRASLRTEQERLMDTISGYVNLLERGAIVQDEFNNAITALDPELKKQNQAMQDGAALRASLRTEQERLMDTISGYVNLLERTAITQDEFNEAIAALDPELKKQNQAMQDGAALRASLRTEQERMMDTISGYANLLERTAITQDEFNEAIAALDPELKKQNQAMQDGAALRASLRTEQERMMDTISGYVNLLERGAISQDEFNNAIAALDPEVQKQNQAMQDGAALTASLRTEQEKMMDTISGYVNLLERGSITQDTFNKAIAALDPEMQKINKIMEEGAALTLEMRTEQEKYADSLEDLNFKLSKGAISQETFNRAVARLGESTSAAKEWQGITRSLTDSLLRGFESGKGFARNFRDTLKNMFNTLILRPIIQPIVQAGANMVLSAIGMGSSATSMAAGLGGVAGGSGSGDALSLVSSLKTAWQTASSYFSGSSAAAAAPNYYAVSPLGSTSSGGAAGAAVGNPALTAAAQYLGAAAAGFVIGKMISGGYSALGKSGNAAVMIGTAIGAWGGPIGMIIGGAIGGLVNRLFGRKLKEVGIQGTFSGEGFSGEQYRYEKGGLFRSNKTTTSALDAALDESMDKSYQSLKLSAITLGNVFMDTSKSLDNFSYSIKLNFLGLDAEASNKLIEGELTKMGDAMASVILADIARAEMATAGIATDLASDVEQYWQDFARAGESSTETLTRLSGSLAGVNGWMDRLGMTMYDTTLATGDMASELVDLFGSMDKFSQSMQSYTERYYTSAERLQMGTADLQQKFDDLGLTMPGTIEEFRALVEAQDLTTESGRNTYASLIGVSESFYGVAQAGNFAALNGRTLMEAWTAQTSIVDGLISSYDGSVASQQTLADAARSRYQVELALVKQIDAALSSTHGMFMSTIDEMKFSTLDTAGKYDFLQAKSSELENLLRAATDPVEIKSLAEQLNQVSRDAWMLLGDDEKRIKIDAYEEYLNELDTLTAAQLAKVKQNINDNGGGQDSAKDAIAAAIASALAAHTGKLMEAALIMKSAADKPVKLEQKVTVDVNVDMPSNVEVGIQ